MRSRPNKKMDLGFGPRRGSWPSPAVEFVERKLSRVFFTPYAPAVHTPSAHLLTNPLVEHAKTTTKGVNGAFTDVQIPVREIMTNHGVTLSLIRIRTE